MIGHRCVHVLAIASVVALQACEEGRDVNATRATGAGELAPVRTSDLNPGPAVVRAPVRNPYAGDANAEREGHRLFLWMNCHGCHGERGGGGIGPPFADSEWIYGSAPDQIYQSIAQGRPNGMPVYGNMIPEDRIWMIVAYVQSLGGVDEAESEHPAPSGNQGSPQQTGSATGTGN